MMKRISDVLRCFEALPQANIDTVLEGRRPLILAPHPDDESLGCGGLIAACCDRSVEPIIIILTDGSASHPDSQKFPKEKLRKLREQEANSAVKLLGLPARNLKFLRYEDAKLPNRGIDFKAAVARIIEIGRQEECAVVIGPWAADPHCDHEAGAAIACVVATQTGWPLLSYPVWGWLREADDLIGETRNGGWRLDITAYLDRKRLAIEAHKSQYGDLIQDLPRGFKLPNELLKIFERPYEVFIG